MLEVIPHLPNPSICPWPQVPATSRGPRLESLIHTGRGKDGMLILWKPDAFGRVVMVVVVRVVLVAGMVVILVVVVVAHVGSEELLPSSDLVGNLRTLGVTLDINT